MPLHQTVSHRVAPRQTPARVAPRQTAAAHTLRLNLDARAEAVYAFVAKPENLPHWAPNFCEAVVRVDEQWRVQTASGMAMFRFTQPETFGVLDHCITLSAGEEIFVGMRVTPQGAQSEISITLTRDSNMSDAQFEQDLQRVEQDLYTLKCIVECLAAL